MVSVSICAAKRSGDGPAIELVCSLTASPSLYVNVELSRAEQG
jgi:hypothetical protein